MKSVLILGTGMVAGPAIQYLLALPKVKVHVADLDGNRARKLIGGHPQGVAHQLNVEDDAALRDAIAAPDLDVVISLLPYAYHARVARLCLAYGKHLITTSYVSPEMQALDAQARDAGRILLNEIGADPGIDHMSAVRVIHRVQADGGEVSLFRSWCGGLPAPEARTNPLGYKFSWSPRGVLLAGRNSAHFLAQGSEVTVPAGEVFRHCSPVEIPGLPRLEGYPNRDSLPYAALYGITTAHTVFRGTLRYPGWCEAMGILLKLGFVGLESHTWSQPTLNTWTAALLESTDAQPESLRRTVAERAGLHPESAPLEALSWLGLFSTEPLPLRRGAPIDILTAVMLSRMCFSENERDMLVMHHEFGISYPDHRGTLTSTLLFYGVPGGDSAMSCAVGLPAAIAARLILEDRIQHTGVIIPNLPEIYNPVLSELEDHGIGFEERSYAN